MYVMDIIMSCFCLFKMSTFHKIDQKWSGKNCCVSFLLASSIRFPAGHLCRRSLQGSTADIAFHACARVLCPSCVSACVTSVCV